TSQTALLTAIHLKADGAGLRVGDRLAFRAMGVYGDGSSRDITESVEWTSHKPSVARFVEKGILLGVSKGQAIIYAVAGPVRSNGVEICVDPGPVLEVTTPRIDLGNVEKDSLQHFTISIRNNGVNNLEWKIATDQPWLVPGDVKSADEYREMTDRIDKDVLASIGTGNFGLLKQDNEAAQPPAGGIPDEGDTKQSLSAGMSGELSFTACTAGLSEGDYTGSVTILSNGGSRKINVSMKIVSLKSIQINPLSIKIRIGQKRTFKAVGNWSDGSRTDLTGHDQGRWIVSDPSVGSFFYRRPVFLAKKTGNVEITRVRGNMTSQPSLVAVEAPITEPVLFIAPREIDLGAIGPGEQSDGVVSLTNVGSQSLIWSLEGPEGWTFETEPAVTGIVEASPRYLTITVMSEPASETSTDSHTGKYPVVLKIETMNGTYLYRNVLPPGAYREQCAISSNGGTRHIFLAFQIAEAAARPHLALDLQGIDMASIETGRREIRKINVKNDGEGILSWKAELQKSRRYFSGISIKRGRYVSLFNGMVANKGKYEVPDRLRDTVFTSGSWFEDRGYPSSNGENSSIKTAFSGTGLVLFLWRDSDGGLVDVMMDDEMIGTIDCRAATRKRLEIPLAENLPEGKHIVTMQCREGNVVLEGMRIYGEKLLRGKDGWIRIYPNLGTTAKETDYVTILITTDGLAPGTYSENILFSSNGGNEIVEVAAEVVDKAASQLLTVYRFSRGGDYLYTTDPGSEDQVSLSAYKNDGAVFRLFKKGTRGTTEFYRWYNPFRNDHFYSYDLSGGGRSLKGYEFEKSIGHIATSRLADTRELYRFYNPERADHFYTTDLKGEGVTNKGYRYDGIAGYVR
ncbi:MAG: hypothetical protein JW736_09090, partial [Deltaproteobacteria bacterium]|nr:hypothetical protein [Deltaproteobacteria bacterium]